MGKTIDDFINEGHCASSSKTNQHSSCGMTLRDYFAAKAMQALVAPMLGMSNEDFDHHMSVTHRVAYKIADAMLAERAK